MLADDFERDGFAELPGFVAHDAIAALRGRAEAIVAGFDPAEARTFSTRDEATTKSEDYFLTSGFTVRCFLEEEALDETGRLIRPKELAVNKIGHAMHDLDPVFEAFSHGAALDAVAGAVGLRDPRIYQSMYIFKQPGIGGEVGWHQDATYFFTEPQSVVTFWFALEDANRENGCLWAQRGGHRGPLRERFLVEGGRPRMERLSDVPWPAMTDAEPIEASAGTLVVFDGKLPHYSAANRSARSRHAYTLHAVDANADYAPANWLQRGDALSPRGFCERIVTTTPRPCSD